VKLNSATTSIAPWLIQPLKPHHHH
jgi:hypothetical protein